MNAPSPAFAVHVAGFGALTGFGFGQARLLDAIARGESAPRTRFFNNTIAPRLLGFNPEVVQLDEFASRDAHRFHQLTARELAKVAQRVIEDALAQADIPITTLAQRRVKVFYGGPGVQPEGANFLFNIRRNDEEDIAAKRGICNLNAAHHDQDAAAHLLRDALGLAGCPVSVHCASNSGLAAAYLAWCAIKSGHCDVAIAVSFQHISLFDLIFVNGFGGLADGRTGPFSANGEGTVLGSGACAMVLESPAHLARRHGRPFAAIDSMVLRQSAGSTVSRGTTFAPDFRIINRAVMAALEACPWLAARDIACVFPHGSGVRSSDRSEAIALKHLWGECNTPVVSYKAQTGYLMAASALVDLALMGGFLQQGSLPGFTCERELDSGLGIHLHANRAPCALAGKTGVKIGLGVEGSVGVVIMRALDTGTAPAPTRISAPPVPAQAAPQLGVYGLSLLEPDARHMQPFTPTWHNAWEANMYQLACRHCAQRHWPLTRFGGGALEASVTREIAYALEISSKAALEEGRDLIQAEGRLGKERLALLYFDGWGQASYLEPAGSWKDSFSIDVIPWKVLKTLQVGAFSCKIRAGRGGFVDALKTASLLLNADAADAVLIGGLFRFHPVLGFSAAWTSAQAERRWLRRRSRSHAAVVERVGFALVGRPPAPGSAAIRLTLPAAARLPAGFSGAAAELGRYWQANASTATTVIGGLSPSLLLAELEAKAAPEAAHINISALYGDSGALNPLVALSHYRTLRPQQGALLCMQQAPGDAQALVVE